MRRRLDVADHERHAMQIGADTWAMSTDSSDITAYESDVRKSRRKRANPRVRPPWWNEMIELRNHSFHRAENEPAPVYAV
jgi:hypothetical protein